MISGHRMAYVCHMDSYLVGSSGFKGDFYKGITGRIPLKDFVVSNRIKPTLVRRQYPSFHFIGIRTAYGSSDGTLIPLDDAIDNGKVFFFLSCLLSSGE